MKLTITKSLTWLFLTYCVAKLVVSLDLDEDDTFFGLEDRLVEMNPNERDDGMKIQVTELGEDTGRKVGKTETRDFDGSDELFLSGLEDSNPEERRKTMRGLETEIGEEIAAKLGPD